MRNMRQEQMFSALPPTTDIARQGRQVRPVPNSRHHQASASTQGKHKRVGARSNWNKIGKHGRAYETTPEPSTRGVIDITKDVRLKLQFLQSMLDYIADADDTD